MKLQLILLFLVSRDPFKQREDAFKAAPEKHIVLYSKKQLQLIKYNFSNHNFAD